MTARYMAAGAVLICIHLVACKPEPVLYEAEQLEVGDWTLGRRGGSLALGTEEFFSLFPPSTLDGVSSVLLEHLFLPPLRSDRATGELTPRLAESWSWGRSRNSITFTIDHEAMWSDGTPVTALDFIDAVRLIYFDEEMEGYLQSVIPPEVRETLRFETDGERNVTVSAPPESSWALPAVVHLPALPMHVLKPVLEDRGIAELIDYWPLAADLKSIPVDGPFRPAKYTLGESLEIKRNPDYFETDENGRRLPYLDRVTIRFYPYDLDYARPYQAGRIDLFDGGTADYLGFRSTLYDTKMVIYGEQPRIEFLTFNQNAAAERDGAGLNSPELDWFRDIAFLDALKHLMNRDRMAKEALEGFGLPQYSFVPRFSTWYWSEIDDYTPAYDREAAAAALGAAGYLDTDGDGVREDSRGNPLKIKLTTNDNNKTRIVIGHILQEDYRAVGIDLDFEAIPFGELVASLIGTGDWQMVIVGITGSSLDPLNSKNAYLPMGGELRLFHMGDAAVPFEWELAMEELIRRNGEAGDLDEKREIYVEAQKLWLKNAAMFFTVKGPAFLFHRPDIRNLYPTLEEAGAYLPLQRVYRAR